MTRPNDSRPAALDLVLVASILEKARTRWPRVDLDDDAFVTHVIERKPDGTEIHAWASAMHGEDLFLACACGRGDAAALAAFDEEHLANVGNVVRRANADAASIDELKQRLREKLFVHTADAPGKIAAYSGVGSLASWLRVVATRLALTPEAGRIDRTIDTDALLGIADGAEGPDVEYMKRLYRSEFDGALADAWQTLSYRDKNLLRYALARNLDASAIATIYRVHRTTTARWLNEAMNALLTAVRKSLGTRLGVRESEIESILRLIRSRIEVALPPPDGRT